MARKRRRSRGESRPSGANLSNEDLADLARVFHMAREYNATSSRTYAEPPSYFALLSHAQVLVTLHGVFWLLRMYGWWFLGLVPAAVILGNALDACPRSADGSELGSAFLVSTVLKVGSFPYFNLLEGMSEASRGQAFVTCGMWLVFQAISAALVVVVGSNLRNSSLYMMGSALGLGVAAAEVVQERVLWPTAGALCVWAGTEAMSRYGGGGGGSGQRT